MATPSFDLAAAHRWFAIEYNNSTWDLLEKTGRTPQETEDMIHGAHASFVHWKESGTEINLLRAYTQITNVYAAIGEGENALRFGKRMLELHEKAPDGIADWDSAFVYDALSRAYRAAGNTEEANRYQNEASAAGEKIADEQSRTMFTAWNSK